MSERLIRGAALLVFAVGFVLSHSAAATGGTAKIHRLLYVTTAEDTGMKVLIRRRQF